MEIPVSKIDGMLSVRDRRSRKSKDKDGSTREFMLKETSAEEFNAHFVSLLKSEVSNRMIVGEYCTRVHYLIASTSLTNLTLFSNFVAKPFVRALKLQSQYVERGTADQSHTETELERWRVKNNPALNGTIPGWPKKEIKMRSAFRPFGSTSSIGSRDGKHVAVDMIMVYFSLTSFFLLLLCVR